MTFGIQNMRPPTTLSWGKGSGGNNRMPSQPRDQETGSRQSNRFGLLEQHGGERSVSPSSGTMEKQASSSPSSTLERHRGSGASRSMGAPGNRQDGRDYRSSSRGSNFDSNERQSAVQAVRQFGATVAPQIGHGGPTMAPFSTNAVPPVIPSMTFNGPPQGSISIPPTISSKLSDYSCHQMTPDGVRINSGGHSDDEIQQLQKQNMKGVTVKVNANNEEGLKRSINNFLDEYLQCCDQKVWHIYVNHLIVSIIFY